MFPIDQPSEERINQMKFFPSLIGILLYEPAAKKYEESIINSYAELHAQSGDALLLLAGRSNWVDINTRSMMDFQIQQARSRKTGSFDIQMLTSLPNMSRIEAAEQLLTLKESLQVKDRELPCIILMPELETNHLGMRPIVYSFDVGDYSKDPDAAVLALVEVFRICLKHVKSFPCKIDANDAEVDPDYYRRLITWRQNILNRVEADLKKAKYKRVLRKVGPGALTTALNYMIGRAT